jgi:hypothetical protein
VAGSISPYVSGSTGSSASSNGTFTEIIESNVEGSSQCGLLSDISFDADIDNVSIIQAVEDRSVNNKGLSSVGTNITRTAVASGAELMRYSGFSINDYLEQAYNSDLDFGTGDFSVIGWVKHESHTNNESILCKMDASKIDGFRAQVRTDSTMLFQTVSGSGGSNHFSSEIPEDLWVFFVFTVTDGGALISSYLNGTFDSSSAVTPRNVSSVDSFLRVGLDTDDTNPMAYASQALLRISATVPSSEGILEIYNAEKKLFEDNSKYLLPSADVQSLDLDEVTDTLLVGTDSGCQKRKGLLNVEDISDTNLTDQDIVSVSLNRDSYTIASAAEAVAYTPAKNLRDELARDTLSHGFEQTAHWFDGDTVETEFTLPYGFKPVSVYENGLLVKDGATESYVINFDGYNYTVSFNSAPAAVDICIFAARVH